MNIYYFGYGMNTSKISMAARCPNSISLGKAILHNFKFRFAYHADIIRDDTSYVEGVLWDVTDKCLESLDMLEGYPIYYDRIKVDIVQGNKSLPAWVYVMTEGHKDNLPSSGYFDTLVEGYTEHDISTKVLYDEVQRLT
jgi:gamma-glutamylcyclotransferase (GGCT)/AIG2-like uncharacterized protein YtfP